MKSLLKRSKSHICSALLKHGTSNFSLEILEYCSPDKCIEREKYYIDLGSEYNIVKDPTLPPMSGRTHSEKTKIKISEGNKGKTHSEKTKKIMSPSFGGMLKKERIIRNYGKTLNDETKQKISDAMIWNTHKKGKPRPEGAGKPSQIFKQ